MSEQEARFIELETRIAFQEDSIQQLNDTIVEQQQSIDRLMTIVKVINQQIRSIPTDLEGSTGNEPPPHY